MSTIQYLREHIGHFSVTTCYSWINKNVMNNELLNKSGPVLLSFLQLLSNIGCFKICMMWSDVMMISWCFAKNFVLIKGSWLNDFDEYTS